MGYYSVTVGTTHLTLIYFFLDTIYTIGFINHVGNILNLLSRYMIKV